MKRLLYFYLCASLYITFSVHNVEAATYEYDELGRVTQVTNEDGSLVTYVYDANGNIVEMKVTNAMDVTLDHTENGINVDNKTKTQINPHTNTQNGTETNVGKKADVHTENNAEYDKNPNAQITDESDTEGEKTESRFEKDDSIVSEEEQNNTDKVLIGVSLTGVLAGIVILVAKKHKKEETDHE